MRLGILGGTFNPIHLGHLVLAEAAREQHRLDEIWFIPTALPPHKPATGLLDGRVRLAMVRLAIRGQRAFRASDIELRLGGISYTLRTAQTIHREHPRATLFLIVGADMLRVRWFGMDELRRLCTFLVAGRPSGPSAAKVPARRRIAMPSLEISSSQLRERVRTRQSIRYLVPEPVERYIARHRLYRAATKQRV